ncbi:hypothetical protein AAVH_37124 [Aphelenchoides avenae]|nr:hypothetical protein AAVH_37124 [Aphelenchus avenae]
MTVRKAKGNCFRAGLSPLFECALCQFKTLGRKDMQNHVDGRTNGRCKTVNRQLGPRQKALLDMPGRETIVVRDSIPERPNKHGADQDVE